MSVSVERDPRFGRRNVRTALWLGLLAAAFMIAFVLNLWLR